MSQTIRQIFYISIFLIVFLFGLVFFLQNNETIEFSYVIGSVELPISLMLLLSLFIGALLGIFALLPLLFRLKKENTRLNKQIRMTEREINNLRVIPVKDTH